MPTRLSRDYHIFAFSPSTKPALRITPGERVICETYDCYIGQFPGKFDDLEKIDWSRVNPATGPIYVDGVLPGDVLTVSVENIAVPDYGVMAACGNEGVLGHLYTGRTGKIVPIREGKAVFDGRVILPVEPMLGVIGVTPEEPVTTVYPGAHGGNLDNKMITAGSVLYLPVFVEGGLLAVGDVHARMGDGEVGVSGIEVNAEVELRVDYLRGTPLSNPLLVNRDCISTIASAETLDEAVLRCTEDMARLLQSATGAPLTDVAMFLSAAGDVRICQVVDPLKTARFLLPKNAVKQFGAGSLFDTFGG